MMDESYQRTLTYRVVSFLGTMNESFHSGGQNRATSLSIEQVGIDSKGVILHIHLKNECWQKQMSAQMYNSYHIFFEFTLISFDGDEARIGKLFL